MVLKAEMTILNKICAGEISHLAKIKPLEVVKFTILVKEKVWNVSFVEFFTLYNVQIMIFEQSIAKIAMLLNAIW